MKVRSSPPPQKRRLSSHTNSGARTRISGAFAERPPDPTSGGFLSNLFGAKIISLVSMVALHNSEKATR
jgi:hypothetical protein